MHKDILTDPSCPTPGTKNENIIILLETYSALEWRKVVNGSPKTKGVGIAGKTWAVKIICGNDGYGGEDHPGSPYDALSDRSSIGPNIQNQPRVGDLEDENLCTARFLEGAGLNHNRDEAAATKQLPPLGCAPARTLKGHSSLKTGNPRKGLPSDLRQLMKRTEPQLALPTFGQAADWPCASQSEQEASQWPALWVQTFKHVASRLQAVSALRHFANPCWRARIHLPETSDDENIWETLGPQQRFEKTLPMEDDAGKKLGGESTQKMGGILKNLWRLQAEKEEGKPQADELAE
ncbi:hypothetical protein K443DRAFT_123538 [Laccaria amethystina LaAM-08-1]|uniref:Uncharacterized protein n=1 Tax=Laccaria amethystina LaAM-08-1 TaxID=1095629 RepID=A0A0C9XB49_9AGAR|nr:hypothetical protein K443DRAFT_123538 [Laccaria amethystina LaAM-08-1]